MRSALAALLLALPAAAQPFERRLPRDTVVYFCIENATRLRANLARGPLPALFALPEARVSLGALRGFLAGRGADPDATWSLLAHPTGQVVIALWDEGGEEFDVDGALLADVRGNERGFLRAWEVLLRAEERDHNVALGEEEIDGVTVHTRAFRARGETTRSAWFLHEGTFGFAPSVGALRTVLVPGGSALSDDEAFGRFSKSLPATGGVRLHVSGRLWSPRAAPALQPALEAAGLDNVAGVGMQLSFSPNGVYSRALIDVRGERRGMLRIFGEPERDLGPPAWLPLKTEAAATFRLDHKELLKSMLAASDAIHPGLAKILDEEVARLAKEKGVDLRRDLVAALGPRTTLALLPLDRKLEALADRRHMDHALFGLVLVQELRDVEAMERVLDAGLSLFGPVPWRTVDGVKVRVVPGRDGGTVAIFGKCLVFARHLDLMRTMIGNSRNGEPGVRRGEAFTRAAGYATRERSAFSFVAPRPPKEPGVRAGDERTRRLLRAAGYAPEPWWRRYHDLSVFSMTDAGRGLLVTWFTGLRAPAQDPTEK